MLATKIFWRIGISITFLIMSACVMSESSTVKIDNSQQDWVVSLNLTGGFAGWMKNTSINSAGDVTINDLKRNKIIKNVINNNELTELAQLISAKKEVKYTDNLENETSICADCFNYKLSIRWHNQEVLTTLNDLELNKSEFKSIVLFMRKITSTYDN